MSFDDIIVALCILLSVFLSKYTSEVRSGRPRQWACCVIGVIMAISISRYQMIFSVVMIGINAIIITILPSRYCTRASFVWCFGFLAVFRFSYLFGLPEILQHTNTMMMFIVLKMTGLAFEVADSRTLKKELSAGSNKTKQTLDVYENGSSKRKAVDGNQRSTEKFNNGCSVNWSNGAGGHDATTLEEENVDERKKKDRKRLNDELQLKYRSVDPSFVDVFLYGYCFFGIFAGPYYKYSVYQDYIQGSPAKDASPEAPRRGFQAIFYLVSHAAFFFWFPTQYMLSDDFYRKTTFLYRVFYICGSFISQHLRYYAAWACAESACMAAGFGAYPEASKPRCGRGPSDLVALYQGDTDEPGPLTFETVKNIKEEIAESTPTLRGATRVWNMSVTWWLVAHVYRRMNNKMLGAFVTMFVSAYWHGVDAGFYFGCCLAPLSFMAETALETSLKPRLSSQGQVLYNAANWMFKLLNFSFLATAFLMKTYHHVMRLYLSLYFFIPIFSVCTTVLCKIIGPPVSVPVKVKSH